MNECDLKDLLVPLLFAAFDEGFPFFLSAGVIYICQLAAFTKGIMSDDLNTSRKLQLTELRALIEGKSINDLHSVRYPDRDKASA